MIKIYPHYKKLPLILAYNLSVAKHSLEDDEVLCELLLGDLVIWVRQILPDYDVDYLSAASRIHKEHFVDKEFDYLGIDEEELYLELLDLKDEYELHLCRGE